jgi:hypothetical protein
MKSLLASTRDRVTCTRFSSTGSAEIGTEVVDRLRREVTSSTFLDPFAPPALPGLIAPMGPLTPARPVLRTGRFPAGNPARKRRRCRHAGLPASRVWPSEHSVPNHLAAPAVAFTHNPSARQAFWASPFASRLAGRPGRNGFVILRTARSPPVAPHLLSQGRSYFRLQAGVCMPEEDFHLSDQTRFQAH